jgi:hypothetical protein
MTACRLRRLKRDRHTRSVVSARGRIITRDDEARTTSPAGERRRDAPEQLFWAAFANAHLALRPLPRLWSTAKVMARDQVNPAVLLRTPYLPDRLG